MFSKVQTGITYTISSDRTIPRAFEILPLYLLYLGKTRADNLV